jgi:hypothetical protein
MMQFARMPKRLRKDEVVLFSRIMHIPHNAFVVKDSVNLWRYGALRFASTWILTLATLVRAAWSTFDVWEKCAARRMAGAETYLSLKDWVARFYDGGWHSSPIAIRLQCANEGFQDILPWTHIGPIFRDVRTRWASAVSHGLSFKLQSELYRALHEHIFPDSIPALLSRRAPRYFPDRVTSQSAILGA